MFCEECNKRPATVHLTQIINDKKTERHLCEQCARENQNFDLVLSFEPNFSIQDLLASLLNQEPALVGVTTPEISVENQCQQCHLPYPQFVQEGKFGCRDCYTHFASSLDPLLRKIHGNAQHNGKIPKRAGETLSHKRKIEQLYSELKTAIHQEAFERAAEIRDQIRSLEKTNQE